MNAQAKPLTLSGLLGDFRLLLMIFIAGRLLLLMVYQPLLVSGVERGMMAGGDYPTYFQIASLSAKVGMPFHDWWTEFPPVWAFSSVAIYQLSGGVYATFALLLGVLMTAFDVGNLLLLKRIGARLHGEQTGLALAWVYALLTVPLVFSFWTFEGAVAFALLLGVWWWLNGREQASALAIAIGALTKFTPALLLGAVWRYGERRRAGTYSAVVLGMFIAVYAALFAQNGAMTAPSLTAQFGKASYQTVWALLDGNYRTGNFGPLVDRLDPTKAGILQGNPARVPGWLRLGAAALIGVWVFWRTRRLDERGFVAFVTITLLIFFLQAQGWSPQWLMQIIPLLLLCFPNKNGVLLALMLSFLTFAEYPFLFIRTGDTGGEISGALLLPFTLLVVVRTGVLVGVCVMLYRALRVSRAR